MLSIETGLTARQGALPLEVSVPEGHSGRITEVGTGFELIKAEGEITWSSFGTLRTYDVWGSTFPYAAADQLGMWVDVHVRAPYSTKTLT